jgi:acyl transferase domain-containing protein/acyl carrier protein
MSRFEGSDSIRRVKEIAVIGMAGRFPGAKNIDAFWENLKKGIESISHFSDDELIEAGAPPEVVKHPHYVKAKGILEDIDCFDADFFGYPPREAERMDPQIRILHECCWEALERAGYNPEAYEGLIGMYVGANENQQWILNIENVHPSQGYDNFLLNYRDYVATRISNKLDLKGPSFTLLTACSTSLVAIHLASQALARGECDMALAGGVSLSLPYKSGYFYQDGLMVSADGHCRTFDAKASGTVFGDGIGMVVLKLLDRAREDRDHIHAVIKGSAVNNDGNGKMGFTAPSINGQKRVILAAMEAAQIEPESIGYIETHGTGTRLGDPVEIEALKQAFGPRKNGVCRLGSVKTNIGHVNIAAGVSSFIKTVLSLEKGHIPSSLHFSKLNPDIDLKGSPFRINTRLTKWQTNGHVRRAGVSAFGFGGTNAHVILEEAPNQETPREGRPYQVLILSAKTESALENTTRNLIQHIKKNTDLNLADVAYTLSTGRKHFPYRRMCVCRNVNDIQKAMSERSPSYIQELHHRPVTFMFPGQGSQYVNMGAELYREEPIFRDAVDRCATMLVPHLGLDIRDILYPEKPHDKEAQERLKQTAVAQSAIFVISYALAKLWMAWGITPDALIGHSIGEYVAAALAGVFSLENALFLVARRGQLMQELPGGSMLAVPLSQEEAREFVNADVSLAAVNAPSLCVLSGAADAVEDVKRWLTEQNLDGRYLHTSHAFHSRMMEPILDCFAKQVEQVERKAPKVPIVSTVTGDWVNKKELTKASYWTRNLRQPVRFSQGIRTVLGHSDGILLEVGPGRTLCTLTKMHGQDAANAAVFHSLQSAREQGSDEAFLLNTLGNLWLSGASVDWPAFYQHEERRRVILPTYPFERQHFWVGTDTNGRRGISRWERLVKIPDMSQWFHVPSWKRSVLPHPAMTRKKKKLCWLIFMDGCGIGSRIADKLRNENQDVVIVSPGEKFEERNGNAFTVHPGRYSDYDALFAELSARQQLPQKIIHGWCVSPVPQGQTDAHTPYPVDELGFFSLLFLAQVMGTRNITQEIQLVAVSNGVHEVTGTEAIDAEKATMLGPLKVIPQEFPNVHCCHVDVVLPGSDTLEGTVLARQIIDEATHRTYDPLVAYRGAYRWVQMVEPIRLEDASKKSLPLRKKGVYLITGGLGGIGLVLAEYLAKTFQARLLLTGRSPFPAKQGWKAWLKNHEGDEPISQKIQKLRQLEKSGAKVVVYTADVTDRDGMQAVISDAMERFGTIHGVIHAAGLPGEGIIQLKKKENAREILAPKVQGTLILDDLLKDVKLDFLFLCSSIASILGGIGLVDYCAANSFMDAFVSHRRNRRYGRMISANWDMWGEVGMGLKTNMPDELQAWLEKELRDGITSQEGIDVFQRILSLSGVTNIIVSTRDLQERIDLWIKREFIKEKEAMLEEKAAKPKYMRPNLSTDYIEPETETEKKVADIWGKLFGIDKVGRKDNFYELGGHSLLATTLINMLKKEFDTNLSIRDVMDHPTVWELSEVMMRS